MNFHQNSLKLLLLLHFSMDSFETMYTYCLGQSSHLLLFSFFKFAFFLFFTNFHQRFIEIATAPTVSLQVGLWVSLHIFFSDFLNLYFLIFLAEFSSKFHSNRYCSYLFFFLVCFIRVMGSEHPIFRPFPPINGTIT